MQYNKKAPAKRTKKAVGGALSAAQKRLLGNAQAGAVKKGAGAITKKMVGLTRKYGDQRKAAAAPAKRKAPTSSTGRVMKQLTPAQIKALRARGQTAKPKKGGIAMSKAARAQLMQQKKLAAASKRPSKLKLFRSSQAAIRRARALAARKRAAAAGRRSRTRRPAVGSGRGRTTINQGRALRLAAARRRAAVARRRAAAIRAPTRRAPTRRAPTRRAPTRRAPTRRPVRRMRRR